MEAWGLCGCAGCAFPLFSYIADRIEALGIADRIEALGLGRLWPLALRDW